MIRISVIFTILLWSTISFSDGASDRLLNLYWLKYGYANFWGSAGSAHSPLFELEMSLGRSPRQPEDSKGEFFWTMDLAGVSEINRDGDNQSYSAIFNIRPVYCRHFDSGLSSCLSIYFKHYSVFSQTDSRNDWGPAIKPSVEYEINHLTVIKAEADLFSSTYYQNNRDYKQYGAVGLLAIGRYF